MKRRDIFWRTLVALLLLGGPSFADLKIANRTSDVIIVAIGYMDNQIGVSRGWFTLNPGETKSIIAGYFPPRSYAFYAANSQGQTWTGSDPYYISSSKSFTIQGKNDFGALPGVESKRFKRAEVISDANDCTIIVRPWVPSLPRGVPATSAAIPLPKAPVGTHQAKGLDKQVKNN